MRKLTKKLLKKSQESFLLALEVFNKPTAGYRTEAFSILFTNAWELLLKAHIFETSGGKKLSIFRRKKRNKKRESLSIDECLKKIFPNQLDPIRKNIEYISEIRNESAHLVIEDLTPYFSRVFQRGVLNFFEHIEKWFNIALVESFKPGLIALISDIREFKDVDMLKKRLSKEDFRSVMQWVDKFRDLEKLGEKATIPITYSIAIVRNTKKSDTVLSSGGKGQEAIILKRYRDIDTSHPHRRKEAMEEIVKRSRKKIKFTTHDFEAFCFVKGIKKTSRNDYYWKPKYGARQYSNKLIDEIITFLDSNSTVVKKIRKQYSNHLSKKRKSHARTI